jgi:restriction endonuclease Mrr
VLRDRPKVAWHLLKLLEQRGRIETQAAYRALAERMGLSAEERAVTIGEEKPESRWENECRWAIADLKVEGYAISQPRGVWTITAEGRKQAKYMELEYDKWLAAEVELTILDPGDHRGD